LAAHRWFPSRIFANLEFSLTVEEAKFREKTDEPLSATDGIAEPVFRHRRLPTGSAGSLPAPTGSRRATPLLRSQQ